MPTIALFDEIEAWQTARELTDLRYWSTEESTFSCDFGLKDPISRAAVSIMSNISEGFESQTQAQIVQYLSLAKASAGEVRSQLYVSRDLDSRTQEQFSKAIGLTKDVSRQSARFIAYLEIHPQAQKLWEDSAEDEVYPENFST